jgi:uncharacterized protein YbaP (TraB family)
MILRSLLKRLIVLVAVAGAFGLHHVEAKSCVWKVTSPRGGTLYLGGSVHALRSKDYPLPPPYNRALQASSRLVLEVDPVAVKTATKKLMEAGKYSGNDGLKKHVDPRTYDYLRRFFALRGVPEQKFSHYRPWMIELMLESAPSENIHLGVEEHLTNRAQADRKPVDGLESVTEHMTPFVGLSDRQSEALLLVFFVNLGRTDLPQTGKMLDAWRRGDTDTVSADLRGAYQDFPAFYDRLITDRNRRWIPKIENYIKSGETVFVVAGAGHMGSHDGVVALLRERGYAVEQQ